MKNRVITISREFGSGGRTIGKKAAAGLWKTCGGYCIPLSGSPLRPPISPPVAQ